MFLPIRKGLDEALHKILMLSQSMQSQDNFLDIFESSRIAAGAAGDMVRRDITRGPAQGNRSATFAPPEKSPGSVTFRGQCVVRRSERQPQIGNIEEAANRVHAGRTGGRQGS